MGDFRKLLPWVSLLLLAVLVPVQAAGCCKWSALLAWSHPAEKRAAAARDLAGGMATGHACCRKQAPPGEDPSPAESATAGKGCCLQDERANAPALASIPAEFSAGPPLPLPLPDGAGPRVAPVLPARSSPETTGPPPYLAHLRLLI